MQWYETGSQNHGDRSFAELHVTTWPITALSHHAYDDLKEYILVTQI